MVTEITDLIREKLKAKQKELGLTDTAFSRKLGISRFLWSLVKNGKRQPSDSFKKKAVGLYPADLAVLYLKEALNTKQEAN